MEKYTVTRRLVVNQEIVIESDRKLTDEEIINAAKEADDSKWVTVKEEGKKRIFKKNIIKSNKEKEPNEEEDDDENEDEEEEDADEEDEDNELVVHTLGS